jgi:hypothetical protein
MDPTIPNVLHQLQNLAHNTQHSSQIAKPCSYSTINPNTRFTKRRYEFAIPHNTQHSSQMVKALLQFHTNMGFSRNSKNLVAIPEQHNT